ncbi:MAG: outer membrane beta-barrel protein, partial [Lutimonas sp.]
LELAEAERTKLYNRTFEDQRSKHGLSLKMGGALMDGDYSNNDLGYSFHGNYKYLFNNPHWSLNLGAGFMELDRTGPPVNYDLTLDGNLEFIFLPYENLTPFIYAGGGTVTNTSFENAEFKFQYGAGVEYLPVENIGIELFGEQNLTFSDNIDGVIQGKRDDYFWRFGLGINFYFGR